MSAIDWTPVLQAAATLAATLFGLCTTYITVVLLPQIIANRKAETAIKQDAKEKASVYAAADTAANTLVADVRDGRTTLREATNPESPVVEQAARSALNRVPASAYAQNTTVKGMQQIIVGRMPVAPVFPTQETKNA